MANPSSRWDFIPVFGVYLNPVTQAPSPGDVSFVLSSRITRVDGRVIYPDGALVKVTIGNQDQQDSTIRAIVRAAWRAADEAAAGGGFDGTAWDIWWDTTIVPAAIFTRFPAADDPDIVQTGWTVTVSEALQSGGGKKYSIQPLLSQLDTPIPGINLGTIEVPPGSPTVPAPVYAKGVAGGVASLDSQAKVPLEQIPDGLGGASTVEDLTDATDLGKALVKAESESEARDAIGAQPAGTYLTSVPDATTGVKGAVQLAAAGDTTSTTKAMTPALVKALVDAVVASAPGALDTLNELAAALGNDAAFSTTVATALAARVRTDTAAQGLTGTQKANARTNIDATLLVVDPGSTSGLADGTLIAYTS